MEQFLKSRFPRVCLAHCWLAPVRAAAARAGLQRILVFIFILIFSFEFPSLLQHVARTIFPTFLGLQPFPGLSSADVQWLQAAGVPGSPSVCRSSRCHRWSPPAAPTLPAHRPGSGGTRWRGWASSACWVCREQLLRGDVCRQEGVLQSQPPAQGPPRGVWGQVSVWGAAAGALQPGLSSPAPLGSVVSSVQPAAVAEGKTRVFPSSCELFFPLLYRYRLALCRSSGKQVSAGTAALSIFCKHRSAGWC